LTKGKLPRTTFLSWCDALELSTSKEPRKENSQKAIAQKATISHVYATPDIISEMTAFSIIENKIMHVKTKGDGRLRAPNTQSN
jgi:hypothetical protein